tara:strand:+ start:65 stop:322 length:258 start_codon:yes stop_codon:yes gene_type:complete
MYASFDFNHVVTLDIPEMGLLDQTVTLDVEIDGELENHHIDAVYLNGKSITAMTVVEAIVERFESDDAMLDAMYDAAHDWLGNRM